MRFRAIKAELIVHVTTPIKPPVVVVWAFNPLLATRTIRLGSLTCPISQPKTALPPSTPRSKVSRKGKSLTFPRRSP